jgi:hypothetical protein
MIISRPPDTRNNQQSPLQYTYDIVSTQEPLEVSYLTSRLLPIMSSQNSPPKSSKSRSKPPRSSHDQPNTPFTPRMQDAQARNKDSYDSSSDDSPWEGAGRRFDRYVSDLPSLSFPLFVFFPPCCPANASCWCVITDTVT